MAATSTLKKLWLKVELVEVMMVVAIVCILAAVAIPAYQDHKAREACAGNQECLSKLRGHHSARQPSTIEHAGEQMCVSGYIVLSTGSQLLDSDGHGIRCR